MLVLVGAFCFQTWLVYTDAAGREAPLSAAALRGRAVWHEHNCQSCHQVYGFGGFLGPDLTNASGHLSAERMQSVLTVGSGQMPALRLAQADIDALTAFLAELDVTGTGQARIGEALAPEALLEQLGREELTESERRGYEIVLAQACLSCHLPNAQSLHRAADLTTVVDTFSRDHVLAVLRDGVPGKAMPALGLVPDDGASVLAFLTWMNANGPRIRASYESSASGGELSWPRVPWFEYE
ncbi:MAG: cytochrome c [bacterium]|nr:cytochrome c [bacterium]